MPQPSRSPGGPVGAPPGISHISVVSDIGPLPESTEGKLSRSLQDPKNRSVQRLSRKAGLKRGGFGRHSSSFIPLEVSPSLLLRVQATAVVRLQAWWRGVLARKRVFEATGRRFGPRKSEPATKVVPSSLSSLGVWTPAQLFSKFEFGAVIGTGNYASVKRCVTKATNEVYAMKIIDKWALTGTLDESLLRDEIAIMRKASHPNCMPLFEVFETHAQYFFQLQLVEGGDLFSLIEREKKLDEKRVCEIIRQLASALQYLHAKSIVHRDIKPENVLLTRDHSTAVLCDFGLAKVTAGDERLMCGTLSYMAPDIVLARNPTAPGYGLAVDCWSLGIVAFATLSGGVPFFSRRRDEEEQLKLIVAAKPSFPSRRWQGVSSRAINFITLALHRDPARRLSAAQMLDHQWLDIFASAASTSPTSGPALDASHQSRLGDFLRRITSFGASA